MLKQLLPLQLHIRPTNLVCPHRHIYMEWQSGLQPKKISRLKPSVTYTPPTSKHQMRLACGNAAQAIKVYYHRHHLRHVQYVHHEQVLPLISSPCVIWLINYISVRIQPITQHHRTRVHYYTKGCSQHERVRNVQRPPSPSLPSQMGHNPEACSHCQRCRDREWQLNWSFFLLLF